jgi:hypothetical protein
VKRANVLEKDPLLPRTNFLENAVSRRISQNATSTYSGEWQEVVARVVGKPHACRHRRLDLAPMNGFETTLQRWHDYYVAAGGAAAVLLGLLFVGLSLHLDREASEDYDVLYRIGTQTMIDLAYALAFALLMLIPISNPMVLGGVLLSSRASAVPWTPCAR